MYASAKSTLFYHVGAAVFYNTLYNEGAELYCFEHMVLQ